MKRNVCLTKFEALIILLAYICLAALAIGFYFNSKDTSTEPIFIEVVPNTEQPGYVIQWINEKGKDCYAYPITENGKNRYLYARNLINQQDFVVVPKQYLRDLHADFLKRVREGD